MENKFQPLDLVEDAKGELFVVDEKTPWGYGLYKAISLRRPELGFLDVSDKESWRICSFPELPKAVRGLLAWRKALDRGGGKNIGTYLSTAIRILDELAAILERDEEGE